jgi:hypothetical protein
MGKVQEIVCLTFAFVAYIFWGIIVRQGDPSKTSHLVACYTCVAANIIVMLATAGIVARKKTKLELEDYISLFIVALAVIVILVAQYHFEHESSPAIYIISVFIALLACLSLVVDA